MRKLKNKVDVNPDGRRSGPLADYGNPRNPATVDAVLLAWGVKDRYLLNPAVGGKPPEVTYAGGPWYMLLFDDGLWRKATFQGINGPPWFSCDAEGVEAATGEIAWLYVRIATAEENVRAAERRLAEGRERLTGLRVSLAEALDNHAAQNAGGKA
jgi:hypothetical protein